MMLKIRRPLEVRKNGFTLVEVIMVLFLITLILGLSAFFFTGFLTSAKFNAAGRELTATIRHARSLARMKMESQTVVIDLDSRAFGIEKGEWKYLPQDCLISIMDPLAGEIIRGRYPIVFQPAGGMGGGTIVLSRGKKVIRIELDPITGAAMIRKGA